MSSPRLPPAVFDILDVADGIEKQKRIDEGASTKHALLQTVEALGTDHSAAVLAEAVDLYLKQQAQPFPVVSSMAAAAPFSFGWKRPLTAETQARRVKKAKTWKFLATDGFLIPVGVVLVLTCLGGAMVGLAGAMQLGQAIAEKMGYGTDGQTITSVIFTFAALVGEIALGFGVLSGSLLKAWRRRFPKAPTTPSTPSMSEWFDGDALPRKDEDYLKVASTRAYLRAVLTSGLPRLMRGDVHQMELLYHVVEDRQKAELQMVKEKDEALEAQTRVIETERLNRQRMVNFADALMDQT